MSELTDALIDSARVAAVAQARVRIDREEQNFTSLFGKFFKVEDLAKIKDYWSKALAAKEAHFLAVDVEAAQEQEDIYESYCDAVKEIGTSYEICGLAKAGVFAHSIMHEAIAGGFAVVGAVLQTGLAILVPGFGSLIGAGANAVLQRVVAHFNVES